MKNEQAGESSTELDRALSTIAALKPPKVEYSVTSDRGTATLEVLAAVKRWLAAVDRANESAGRANWFPLKVERAFWPLFHKKQQALVDLEAAARKLELAK